MSLPPPRKNKPPYRVPLMSEINSIPWNGFNVVSTFSGCGGSCLGYRMAGFKVLWANEFLPKAQESYKVNHPDSILDGRSIIDIQPQEIINAIGGAEIDILDGSPPCQAFSMAGQREKGWGKAKKYENGKEQCNENMFFEYIRLLKGLQPKVFIAENVKGLTIGTAKKIMGDFQDDMFDSQDNTILRQLMDCGYKVEFRVLNAANYGVPQNRVRVIFQGVRRDLNINPVWPKPLRWIYSVVDSCYWVGLAKGENKFLIEPESCLKKYSTGKEWEKLKPGEQSDKYFSEIKVDPSKPSPTILASHGSPGIASPVHPFECRKFSIAEIKRLTSFPDDFVLIGSYAQQWERIGNSVAPVFMKHIATAIRDNILMKL